MICFTFRLGSEVPSRAAGRRDRSTAPSPRPATRSSGGARPSGGLEHAVATSSASSLPGSLREAPGRGSSLRTLSRLPSTNWRLVRYTIDPSTLTLLAIVSSAMPTSPPGESAPVSACAPHAATQHGLQFTAFGLAEIDQISYVHRCLRTVGGPDESTVRAMSFRSEEHTSELQSLMRISYAVFCL